MKAGRKSTIADDFLEKNGFSKILHLYLSKEKNFECNSFKKIFIQPPKLYFSIVLNTKNDIYMKV